MSLSLALPAYPALGKIIDHDAITKVNRRSRNSFQKSHCPDEVCSSSKLESMEREISCIKANKKKKKKSRKSSRRSTSKSNMVREDSLTSFVSHTSECRSCHQSSMNSTEAQMVEIPSSLNHSKWSAVSLTNRYEMISILEGIRAQREQVEVKGQFYKAAVKIALDKYFEEQRRVILWKWKAMDIERKSRAAAQHTTRKCKRT